MGGVVQRERITAATTGQRYIIKLTVAGFINADDEQIKYFSSLQV